MFRKIWQTLALINLLILSITLFFNSDLKKPFSLASVGNPSVLQKRYEMWKLEQSQFEGKELFTLSFTSANNRDYSTKTSISGKVHFNFQDQRVISQITGLNVSEPIELWASIDLVRHGFTKSKSDVSTILIGQYVQSGDRYLLDGDISKVLKTNFRINQVVVSPVGRDPLQSALLVASPTVFQRLYATEIQSKTESHTFAFTMPMAFASEDIGFPEVFNDLVAHGEDIFFNETFNGNGRSCGTCHPVRNNFVIDCEFIASLPPTDPLFVAEFIPALIFDDPENRDAEGNPQRFENPELLREFGLIVENQDGMDDLENRFNMRGIPHNIGMSASITTPVNGLTPPDDRTGWSGDGSPVGTVGGIAVSGRVRDFLLGAIVQHYPLTLARRFDGPNPDFRIPTFDELDALEAFLFSLGRQNDIELREGLPNQLVLKDEGAEKGKMLFRDGVPGIPSNTCMECHGNAGANVLPDDPVNPTNNFGNRNFNVGIELFLQNRINDPDITILGESRPFDGGFGTNPSGNFTSLQEQPGFVNENFGDQTFNTVSLIEAADTPPFFHNNAIKTLEDAIRFYNSSEFIDPNNDGVIDNHGIPFNETQVIQVANFLRVINALHNIDNFSLIYADRTLYALTIDPTPHSVICRIIQNAIAETQDAVDVLNEGALHNKGGESLNAVKHLAKAIKRFQSALNTSANSKMRIKKINQAKTSLHKAVTVMRH